MSIKKILELHPDWPKDDAVLAIWVSKFARPNHPDPYEEAIGNYTAYKLWYANRTQYGHWQRWTNTPPFQPHAGYQWLGGPVVMDTPANAPSVDVVLDRLGKETYGEEATEGTTEKTPEA